MSKRSDIVDGSEAIHRHYGLVYTCNLGWLDLGHMNPQEIRRNVGAAALWRQVRAGGPNATAPWCGWPYFRAGCGPGPGGVKRGPAMPAADRKDTTIRFSDGATGFKVISIQQMGKRLPLGMSVQANFEREYVVRHGLNEEQKRSVALAIFMDVSVGFERMQGKFPYGLASGDSSFSQEDLVSNLIGFHIAIGAVTKAQALAAAHPVSKTAALQIWDRNGSVGSNKHQEFTPKLVPNTSSEDMQSCRDECFGQPRTTPAFLSKIQPAKKGTWFMDFPRA